MRLIANELIANDRAPYYIGYRGVLTIKTYVNINIQYEVRTTLFFMIIQKLTNHRRTFSRQNITPPLFDVQTTPNPLRPILFCYLCLQSPNEIHSLLTFPPSRSTFLTSNLSPFLYTPLLSTLLPSYPSHLPSFYSTNPPSFSLPSNLSPFLSAYLPYLSSIL